jgi:predicted AAA+ superfamily ATPase
VVDENRQQKGRFILTLSSSFELMKNISETLAGRIVSVELAPFKSTLKLPKGHFRDSGLNLFLQNVANADKLSDYHRLGNIFECFVVEEIIRGISATDARNLQYSHFRTKAGGKIDLIVEGSFGTIPIEIKYQSHTTKKSLTAMMHFIDTLDLPLGIVVNHCPAPAIITEKIIQIPVSCI